LFLASLLGSLEACWGRGDGGTQSGGPDEQGEDQPGPPLELGGGGGAQLEPGGGGTHSGGPVSSMPQLRALSFLPPCRLKNRNF
jgi:hypothetical protein